MTRMQNEPDDRHVLYLLIRQKLGEIKAYGMPLPEDLGLTGAGHGERSPTRINQRNGYRERIWGDTRRRCAAGNPQKGLVLSCVPGAATRERDGPDRRDPGGLGAGACRRARSTICSKPWA
jgi:hypothetical protein